MKEKQPSDPITLKYTEAEYVLPEEVFIAALEPLIKLAEKKVLGHAKDKKHDESN